MAANMKLLHKLFVNNKLHWGSVTNVTRKLSTLTQPESQNNSVSDVDIYPEVVGKYPPGEWGQMQEKIAWKLHRRSEELKQYRTAKERLEAIAGDEANYMTKCEANDPRPNTLLYKQYVTKTNVQKNALPDIYKELDMSDLSGQLKGKVEDAILLHNEHSDFYVQQNSLKLRMMNSTHEYLQKIIASILPNISLDHEHLLNSQLDESVRVETFWNRGGYLNENGNRTGVRGNWCGLITLQYKDMANWQIRTENPLPEFLPREHDLCKGASVDCNISPNSFGQVQIFTRPTNVSGHWIGDPCEWAALSFHTPRHLEYKLRSSFDDKVFSSMLHDMAVVAGFGSCVSQAHNQGFNSYLDITYPITTQTVSYSGNGEFYFCAYQLNTIQLYKDDAGNPYCNLAWVSGPHRLYDTVESGQVKGFNENTLQLLLKFFTIQPVDRSIDLRPYLPYEKAPINVSKFINNKGEPPIRKRPIGRFEYPRNSVYFQ